MDFGTGSLEWLRFVPDYHGNRKLPEGDRISLEIRRLRSVDMMVMAELDEDELYAWRDRHFEQYAESLGSEVMATVKRLPLSILRTLRIFVEHTRDFRNFEFDGVAETDATKIFLQLPLFPNETPLTEMIAEAIAKTAGLGAEEVKNYEARLAGTPTRRKRAARASTPSQDSGSTLEGDAITTSGTPSR